MPTAQVSSAPRAPQARGVIAAPITSLNLAKSRAPISGVVERIGFAYRGDERYRYVELADTVTQRDVRVLYVGPLVQLGAVVEAGDPIGLAQDLSARYPRGITNHVHVELRQSGALSDPANLFPDAEREHAEIDA